MWLDLGFVGEHAALLHAEPAWATVVSYREQFFSRRACAGLSAPSGAGQSAAATEAEKHGVGRMLFPCVLEAFVDDSTKLLEASTMPTNMHLLGGQAIAFAWYVAAARTVQDRNT